MIRVHRRESGFALVLVLLVLAVALLLAAPLLSQTVTGRAGVRQAEARQQAYELAASGLELVQWYYAGMRRAGLPPQQAIVEAVEAANASPYIRRLPGEVELRLESVNLPNVVIDSTGTVDSVRPDGGTKPVTAAIRATFRLQSNVFMGEVFHVSEVDEEKKDNIRTASGQPASWTHLEEPMFQKRHADLLAAYQVLSPSEIDPDRVVRQQLYVIDRDVDGDVLVDGDVRVASGVTVTGRIVATGNVTIEQNAENVYVVGGIYAGKTITIKQNFRSGEFGCLIAGSDIVIEQNAGKQKAGSNKQSGQGVTVNGSVVSKNGQINIYQNALNIVIKGNVMAGLDKMLVFGQNCKNIAIYGAVVGGKVQWGKHCSLKVGGIGGKIVDLVGSDEKTIIIIDDQLGSPDASTGKQLELIFDAWQVDK